MKKVVGNFLATESVAKASIFWQEGTEEISGKLVRSGQRQRNSVRSAGGGSIRLPVYRLGGVLRLLVAVADAMRGSVSPT